MFDAGSAVMENPKTTLTAHGESVKNVKKRKLRKRNKLKKQKRNNPFIIKSFIINYLQ